MIPQNTNPKSIPIAEILTGLGGNLFGKSILFETNYGRQGLCSFKQAKYSEIKVG